MLRLFYIIFIVGTPFYSDAQKDAINPKQHVIDSSKTITKVSQEPCDSLVVKSASEKKLIDLYRQGYLSAAYRLVKSGTCFVSSWRVGKKFLWADLTIGNVPQVILSKSGYQQRFFANKPFRPKALTDLLNKIVQESENNGYPFASVKLDSIAVDDNTIHASLFYDGGPYITFDDLKLNSAKGKVKKEWLASFLGIKEGQKFNQQLVGNISEKIEQLPFLKLLNPPVVTFQNLMAEVTLSVEEVSANSIDGIVGFLPNEQEDGRLLVTGQLFLRLNNLFSSGKSLDLDWQSIKPRSQLLDISYVHPNIAKSPVGAIARFYLLKEDTFFINRESSLEAVYNRKKTTVSLLYQSKASSTLVEANTEDINDLSINAYGGRLVYNDLHPSIKNGRYLELFASMGAKNLELSNVDMVEIDESSPQYVLQVKLSHKFRVVKNLAFFNETSAGKLFNDFIFRNDMFRLGGLNSLRGFNENFFFASEYILLRSEVQLYFQNRSYLYIFYDQSYMGYESVATSDDDHPLGLGFGAAIDMKNGILNIAYALGKSEDQPLDTRLSKFHFGYVLKF